MVCMTAPSLSKLFVGLVSASIHLLVLQKVRCVRKSDREKDQSIPGWCTLLHCKASAMETSRYGFRGNIVSLQFSHIVFDGRTRIYQRDRQGER